MTFRHRRSAQPQAGPVLTLAVLAVSVVPPILAQSDLPRFERAECPVNGAWAGDARRECGWLTVQESRDSRSSSTARLAVEIFRARAPNGMPPLVMLHGGPGGAGGIRIYSPFVATGPFAQHRDVVIYDQRGAGFSQPKLCPTYEAVADSARDLGTKAEKDQRWAQGRLACLAELRAKAIDPLAYNTAASAADLIDLRGTLGYASWDIFSESYGARLAQEAMVRDGPAIRSVVLASSVSRSPMRELEAAVSEQRAFEHLFAACSAQRTCHEAFPVVEQDFYADYEQLNDSPLAVSIERPGHAADTVWLDGTRLVNDIRNRLFPRAPANVARVPLLLHELRAGDRMRAARAIVGDSALGPGGDAMGERALREITICYDSPNRGNAQPSLRLRVSERRPRRQADRLLRVYAHTILRGSVAETRRVLHRGDRPHRLHDDVGIEERASLIHHDYVVDVTVLEEIEDLLPIITDRVEARRSAATRSCRYIIRLAATKYATNHSPPALRSV
jgi:pimeloyl-ACP methyl ester carboxylesterase